MTSVQSTTIALRIVACLACLACLAFAVRRREGRFVLPAVVLLVSPVLLPIEWIGHATDELLGLGLAVLVLVFAIVGVAVRGTRPVETRQDGGAYADLDPAPATTAGAARAHDDRDTRSVELGDLVSLARVAATGELTASIAHEISNPCHTLAVNLGFLEALWQDLDPIVAERLTHDPDERIANMPASRLRENMPELLRGQREAIDRLAELLASVHRLSRLRTAPERRPVELCDAIADARRLLAHRFRRGGYAIELHVGNALPPIRADRNSLTQIVTHLLLDACAVCDGSSTTRRASSAGSEPVLRVETSHDTARGRVALRITSRGCRSAPADRSGSDSGINVDRGANIPEATPSGACTRPREIREAVLRRMVEGIDGELWLDSSGEEALIATVCFIAAPIDSPSSPGASHDEETRTDAAELGPRR